MSSKGHPAMESGAHFYGPERGARSGPRGEPGGRVQGQRGSPAGVGREKRCRWGRRESLEGSSPLQGEQGGGGAWGLNEGKASVGDGAQGRERASRGEKVTGAH
jgi:hypothetical protein